MEGKWLIADRDLNEREGLKWLLKSSSNPVTGIHLAANYQEFVVLFERETPDILLIELDMISREDWSSFRELMQIYHPVLLFTSAEATFEKARLAIDMQALDLMIKPFSSAKVKTAFQRASRHFNKNNHSGASHSQTFKALSYEALFLSEAMVSMDFLISAFKTESAEMTGTLHSFLTDYPFKDLHGIFPLSDMVVLLFEKSCSTIRDQCQKAMRRWEEDFSEPLATVIHTGKSTNEESLHKKYKQTRKMLEFTYYQGFQQVIEFHEAPNWGHFDPFLSPPEQRIWVDMLTNLDLENMKKWLYDEFLQLDEPFPDPGLVRIRLTSILAQLRRFMKTNNLDGQESFERGYRHIFHSILYDTVLYRTVQNLILFTQKLFIGAESNLRNSKQDPIERGISFMEANFSKNELRLEEVAQYVDRNPSYFSHLLTVKTGVSFTEVLTGIRMKEAKRLLLETTKPIKEISIRVGFKNPNYFSRIFKETVGLSPREFRMNKVEGKIQSYD